MSLAGARANASAGRSPRSCPGRFHPDDVVVALAVDQLLARIDPGAIWRSAYGDADRLPGRKVVLGTPRQMLELDAAEPFEHPDRFSDDLWADAVARNDRDTVNHAGILLNCFRLPTPGSQIPKPKAQSPKAKGQSPGSGS